MASATTAIEPSPKTQERENPARIAIPAKLTPLYRATNRSASSLYRLCPSISSSLPKFSTNQPPIRISVR